AAKLYYKMLSYKFQNEDVEDGYNDDFNNNNNKVNNFSKFNEDDEY
ncbi:agmatinase, partial [Seonamhaeicola marinus]